MGERAEDTFQMRLGEPRRLQIGQKGGSGRPNELPSLLHKATVDIGGAAFGRLGGGNSPNLDAAWFPNRLKLEIQNIAKTNAFPCFDSFFAPGGSETREIAATDG